MSLALFVLQAQGRSSKRCVTEVESSNIVSNQASFAYDLTNVKPHQHLCGHQTVPQRFPDRELRQAAGLKAPDHGLHAVDGLGDLTGCWRCKLDLSIVPERGQARLRVRHSSAQQLRPAGGEALHQLLEALVGMGESKAVSC